MKMKPKMLLGSTVISVGAVLLTTVGILSVASNLATEALQTEVTQRLILQRDMQKDQIENYIAEIGAEVAESANLDGVFATALNEFINPFTKFQQQVPDSADTYRQNVENFYNEQFTTQFTERNASVAPLAVSELMTKLDDNTIALQNYYIAENPNPLGKKDELTELEGVKADYAGVHAKYHPRFKEYLSQWGFYDAFLVDANTGYIVYSVFKKLDYATSLVTGPYADSGLGKAFKQALTKEMQGKSYTSDMAPYYPSYNDYAAFVSSPLYIEGQLKGVFIVQMPLDKINKVMTFNQRWADYGLGESGETYLVADDLTMRNDRRFLIDNKKAYLKALQDKKIPAATLQNISKKNSSIGLQKIESPSSKAALAGNTGVDIFQDYRNIPVLSAYAPLSVAGLNWAILAEVDEAEAFAPVKKLINDILKIAIIMGLILIGLSLILSFFFANSIVTPITYFRDIMERFKSGESELRVHSAADDEIGELATAFDALLDEREQTLQQITDENDALNESVIAMLQIAAQLSQGDLTAKMVVGEDITGPLADSLNLVIEQTSKTLSQVKNTAIEVELAAKTAKQQSDKVLSVSATEFEVVQTTAEELGEASRELTRIAELAKQCNTAADAAIITTDKAQQTVLASVDGINNIRDNISETEKRIKRLGERSQEIAGVTSIINGIAEKTHVLALNASMQAASAGEAGRGFAVVATEIQRLAESASEATTEIGALIKNIQVDTADTVTTMNKAITQVVEGSRMAENAGSQMLETREKSNDLVKLVQQIAASSENQVAVSLKLQHQAEQIQQGNMETAQQLSQQAIQTNKLVDYATNLLKAISTFKIAS